MKWIWKYIKRKNHNINANHHWTEGSSWKTCTLRVQSLLQMENGWRSFFILSYSLFTWTLAKLLIFASIRHHIIKRKPIFQHRIMREGNRGRTMSTSGWSFWYHNYPQVSCPLFQWAGILLECQCTVMLVLKTVHLILVIIWLALLTHRFFHFSGSICEKGWYLCFYKSRWISNQETAGISWTGTWHYDLTRV